VDYNLMSNVPGLHVLGEANFSDHGANRLGASALMQGLADGYFVIPQTIGNYLVEHAKKKVSIDHPEFKKAEEDVRSRTSRLLAINGRRTVDSFHRELGLLLWDLCGMARSEKSLQRALKRIPTLREEFWKNVKVPGENNELNMELEKAGPRRRLPGVRRADVPRRLGAQGVLRRPFPRRNSKPKKAKRSATTPTFAHVAAWEYTGDNQKPNRHAEPLEYENIHLATRSYK
jgi:succinate dehydrogenase / fumarate reductase flavoprotein subunit